LGGIPSFTRVFLKLGIRLERADNNLALCQENEHDKQKEVAVLRYLLFFG